MDSVRFVFDGTQLIGTHSPADWEMEEGDVIYFVRRAVLAITSSGDADGQLLVEGQLG